MDIKNLELMWTNFTKGGRAIVTEVAPAYDYKDGQRLDKVVGLKVTVVLPANHYDTLTVKVTDPVDRLSAVVDKGDPVYVDFKGFTARVYTMNGRTGISAKADSVQIVDDNAFIDLAIE